MLVAFSAFITFVRALARLAGAAGGNVFLVLPHLPTQTAKSFTRTISGMGHRPSFDIVPQTDILSPFPYSSNWALLKEHHHAHSTHTMPVMEDGGYCSALVEVIRLIHYTEGGLIIVSNIHFVGQIHFFRKWPMTFIQSFWVVHVVDQIQKCNDCPETYSQIWAPN